MTIKFMPACILGGTAAILLPAFNTGAQTAAKPDAAAVGEPKTQDQSQALAGAIGQDIVVTARRRPEWLLNVPIAFTVYSGERLGEAGAIDIEDIQITTPNVTGFGPRGTATNAPISNAAAGRTYRNNYNFFLFRPETVNSYELGWKGALFDCRVTLAAAGNIIPAGGREGTLT